MKVGSVRHRGESKVTSKSYGKEVRCSITRIQTVTRGLQCKVNNTAYRMANFNKLINWHAIKHALRAHARRACAEQRLMEKKFILFQAQTGDLSEKLALAWQVVEDGSATPQMLHQVFFWLTKTSLMYDSSPFFVYTLTDIPS